MPTYKQLPKGKKKAKDLPLYRPIDRLVLGIWSKRKSLMPAVVVGLVLFLIYGGLRIYAVRSERETRAAHLSRLKSAKKALDEKNYDGAIEELLPVTQGRWAEPILKVNALQNLAFAYLKKGEFGRAVEILDRAVQDPANAAPDYSRLLLAKAYEVKGDGDGALEIYKILSETVSPGPVQQVAKERVGWFESQGKK